MVRIAKALARLAGAREAVREPGETAIVERDGPLGALAPADHAVVEREQREEGDDRREDPERADRARAEDRDRGRDAGCEDREPRVREPPVAAAEGLRGAPPERAAERVLFGRAGLPRRLGHGIPRKRAPPRSTAFASAART